MTPDELLAEWRAAYKQQFPRNDETAMRYEDSALALGALLLGRIECLEREMERLKKTRVIEPAFAAGVEPQTSARPTGKRRSTDGH